MLTWISMEKLSQNLIWTVINSTRNNFITQRLFYSKESFYNNLMPKSSNKKRKKTGTANVSAKYTKMTTDPKQSPDIIKRDWTTASDDATTPPNSVPFTLMSYNVLAQDLINIHPQYYHRHGHEALDWNSRFGLLIKEIASVAPHILCLQEVQKSHLDEYVKALTKLNLTEFVFKKRTGDQTDGCAIFFNSDVFTLVDRQTVEYYQPSVKILDRKNVAIIIKLSLNKYPESLVVIATTHLLYNPRRQDVRLAQIQVLLAELDRISCSGYSSNGQLNYAPIILTGDLNLQPNSAPYRLLTEGVLKYNNLTASRLEDSENLSYHPVVGDFLIPKHLAISDYCQHVKFPYESKTQLYHSQDKTRDNILIPLPDLNEYPFQTGTLRHKLNLFPVYNQYQYVSMLQYEWILVDYIFYSKEYNSRNNTNVEKKLKLLSYYTLPTRDAARNIGLIPNKACGSDHLSIAAKFLLVAI